MQTKEEKNKLSIFSKNFNELRGERTQADFATFLDISRPTVGFYENGERLPDALTLKKIAEKCHVPSDWLLGLTTNKNSENIAIGKQLGLSDTAIELIKRYMPVDNNKTLNIVLESSWLYGFIDEVGEYLDCLNLRPDKAKSPFNRDYQESISAEKKQLRKDAESLLGKGTEILPPMQAAAFHLTYAQYLAGKLIEELGKKKEGAINGDNSKA